MVCETVAVGDSETEAADGDSQNAGASLSAASQPLRVLLGRGRYDVTVNVLDWASSKLLMLSLCLPAANPLSAARNE